MKILTVTSGKGGVGKTTISLNIARQLSLHGLRTLIIDFDIHNKGTTGLFLPQITDSSCSVLAIVHGSNGFDRGLSKTISENTCLINLKENLFLLPAACPSEMIQWSKFVAPNQTIIDFFHELIEGVCKKHSIDVVVIDCYGGIDSLTVAAIGLADDTIIVNEPDVVTFSGTLTLYSYLANEYSKSIKKPRIHFVINRISFRHSFSFLKTEYKKHLSNLSIDRDILAYLPFDKLVMETFGDHPFFTELLPKGLITKKIRLLIGMLWNDEKFSVFKVPSEKKHFKIYSQTIEQAFADPEKILRGAVTAPLWLMIPLSIYFLLSISKNIELPYLIVWFIIYFPHAIILIIVLYIAVFEPIQISRWLLRYAGYKRLKRKYQEKIERTKQIFFSFFEYLRSLTPSFFGVFFLFILFILFMEIWNNTGLRDLRIWKGKIYGFSEGGNYTKLKLDPRASITDSDLKSANLSKAVIDSCIFNNINFTGADLSGASISSAKFRDVNLYKAKMDYANGYGSIFVHCNLKKAELNQSAFTYASFISSELGGKNSNSFYFDGSRFFDCTISNWNFDKTYLQGIDFGTTKFDSVTFDSCNLKAASFISATFSNVSFRKSDLSGANFSGAKFINNNSLEGAILDGCNFRGADLSKVDLSKIWFESMDLTEAILSGNQKISEYNLWVAKQRGAKLDENQMSKVDRLENTYADISRWWGFENRYSKENIDDLVLSYKEVLKDRLYDGDSLAYYYNLIELLLIRNKNDDLNEAKGFLTKLGKVNKIEKYKGEYVLLNYELAVISGNNEFEQAREWLNWIDRNEILGEWSWELWNRYFESWRYSKIVNIKLRMLQHSATGILNSDAFKFCFYPDQLNVKN